MNSIYITLCLFFFYLFSNNTYSGVIPSQSRLIYHEQDTAQSLMLANTNDYPVIVQNWIDRGEGDPDVTMIPFISIPSIIKMDPSDIQGIRVIYNKDLLPQDRESLFWLNIYEVPPRTKYDNFDSSLLITMNTQIKFFFRPKKVNIIPETAVRQIKCWRTSISLLECNNPTAIHLSIIGVKINDNNTQENAIGNDFLIKPFSKKTFEFTEIPQKKYTITITYINDNGEFSEYSF